MAATLFAPEPAARSSRDRLSQPSMVETGNPSLYYPQLPTSPHQSYTYPEPTRYSRHSIAKRGLLDDSAPSSPSPRASYVSTPKVGIRDSYQSSQSSEPISQPPLAHISDPEKRGSNRARTHSLASSARQSTVGGDQYATEDPLELKSKAFRILLYLSAPCGIVSLLVLLWTLLSLLITLILAPFHLLSAHKSPRNQLVDLLAPPLRLQLALIAAEVPHDTYSGYDAPLLVVVLLFAPIVSLGVAVASWVAAVFWFYAAILGDPDGSERQRRVYGREDNDGRASVLGVRAWWKKWLTRALR